MQQELLKAFGYRLKEERLRLRISQDEFAKMGGVKRASQYIYEQGDRAPTVDYLVRVVKAGCDLGFLVFGERTGNIQERWCFEKSSLIEVFNLVDEYGRDSKGRLLDKNYRQSLFEALCAVINNKGAAEIEWNEVQTKIRDVLSV